MLFFKYRWQHITIASMQQTSQSFTILQAHCCLSKETDKMVRNYVKKRTGQEIVEEDMEKAVIEQQMPLRHAANIYGIKHTSLFYRVKKAKNADGENINSAPNKYSTKYTFRQVFTTEQESLLEEYILRCSKMNYGLTYRQIRVLAFEYAAKIGCSFPSSWKQNNIAGVDWIKGFMKRHSALSLRKPENTSLSRSTSFNKHNVALFQENLAAALKLHTFSADRFLNLDEIGVTTVIQAPNIVAKTGTKRVGQAVSAERGTLITMCGIVTASGNTIPPVFIFPRARMHESLMHGAPIGSLGLTNSPSSGWMTAALFIKTLEHIQKHTRCSKDDPILVVMDNHEAHCSLDAVIYAKEHGLVLLTIPPHCTHRLQPLDVSVMGSFKSNLMVVLNDWMIANPGRTITIHNLAALSNKAYTLSFTMANIISGFRKTGIYPYSTTVFSEDDFEPAFVTNRPMSEIPHVLEESAHNDTVENEVSPQASTSTVLTTPESVRPYPKAQPRKNNRGGRKKGRSRILTLTPEKNAIEAEHKARQNKRKKSKQYNSAFEKTTKKRLHTFVDSSSDEDGTFSVHDETDFEDTITDMEDEEEKTLVLEDLNVNDFILVKFATKKTILHYVGQIEWQLQDKTEFNVKFLRKKENDKFYFPETSDISLVDFNDIVKKLPQPNITGGTLRAVSAMSFDVNFDGYKFG